MKLVHSPVLHAISTLALASCGTILFGTLCAPPAQAGSLDTLHASQVSPRVELAEFDVDDAVVRTLVEVRRGRPAGILLNQLETFLAQENALYEGMPDACYIQEHLASEIAALRAQAARYTLRECEIVDFQREIALGRFERAALEIRTARDAGRGAEDVAEKAIQVLTSQVLDYLDSLPTVSVRARLQDAVDRMTTRAEDAYDRLAEAQIVFRATYGARLESAIDTLQRQMSDGRATIHDFDRVQALVASLEHIENRFLPNDCGS